MKKKKTKEIQPGFTLTKTENSTTKQKYITSQNKKKPHKPHSKTQKTRAKPTLLVQF
jgi:hypothetical protein